MFCAMASSCESSAWCVSLKFPAWPELNASSGASVGVSREFCATSLPCLGHPSASPLCPGQNVDMGLARSTLRF